MRPLGRALLVLGAIGLVLGAGAEAIILTSSHIPDRGTWAAFCAVLGGSFVGAGLYAWWRRPHNRSGALMTWVGVLWFLAPLSFSDNAALFITGHFTEPLPIPALAHLVLAVPRGRLESRYHRRLIGFGYLTATLLQVPGVLFLDTADDRVCRGCPANPLLIAAGGRLADLGAALVNVCAAGVTAGSLAGLHGDAIALADRRAAAVHARVGSRVAVMLGDGIRTHATVAAIYTRALAFGDALLSPQLAAGHVTSPLLATIFVDARRPGAVARRVRALGGRYPGLRVSRHGALATVTDADLETNRWLGPFFVAIILGFASIAVVNTLVMIGLQRGRELALLRLVGGTPRQVRSMARWEAGLIVAIGLGVGLAIAATALLPLSHALTGGLRPFVPLRPLAAILGGSALLALLALALPTRRALRTRPVVAIGARE